MAVTLAFDSCARRERQEARPCPQTTQVGSRGRAVKLDTQRTSRSTTLSPDNQSWVSWKSGKARQRTTPSDSRYKESQQK
eukprot:574047-Amphidinium_carterae.1